MFSAGTGRQSRLYRRGSNNLGSTLQEKKNFAEAETCYRGAIELRPDLVVAYNNLGSIQLEHKQFDLALETYQKALDLNPRSAEALSNFGQAAANARHDGRGHRVSPRKVDVDPQLYRAHFNLAAALHYQLRMDEALASYAEVIRLKPDFAEAYYNRSFVWLSQGNLAAGWPDYEWRLKCKDYTKRRFDGPTWDGSPLEGRTLLIHAEQGLGDTLHFIRYVKWAASRGGTVAVEVQPALAPLLKTSGYTNAIAGGSPLPKYDAQISLLSLPGLCRTTLETIPADVPYLAADPRLLKTWRAQLRKFPGFKVGIVWQGNAAYTFDHFRSIPLRHFAPLADVPRVQLISLQKNAGVEQIAALEGQFDVVDLGSALDTQAGAFMDTAAVMCNLDLIITSDTAAAHLAGGLGVPVWVGLSSAPEWRWMNARQDSPWYPSMRLFRQPSQNDWASVFAEMRHELAELVARRSSGH